MEVIVQKIGNSHGIIIPASILMKLGLKSGDKLKIVELNGQIIAAKAKPQYTLRELLAKCDPNADFTEELKEWDQMKAVGLECAFSAAARNE